MTLLKRKDEKIETDTKSPFPCIGSGNFLQFKLIIFLADELALQTFSEHSLLW